MIIYQVFTRIVVNRCCIVHQELFNTESMSGTQEWGFELLIRELEDSESVG